ncbi:hypothetical protein KC887_04475 [Candidatus Kaiserbacteria bacterium]|nr:hypothetical protein [Candidatus Kaiserbacteria bacterium]
MKQSIVALALFTVLATPSFASAAMQNATPADVLTVLYNELSFRQNAHGQYPLASAATGPQTGLMIKVDGTELYYFRTANQFNVAKEMCYLFVAPYLGTTVNYTCEFDGTLIFESAVDAKM